MSLWKDTKLYFTFVRTLKENENDLLVKFNLKIDNAGRLYTVLTIPKELFGDYNLRSDDINYIAQNYIKEYTIKLGEFLNDKSLTELYGFDEPIKKLDKYSYLLVIGYKRLSSRFIMKSLYTLTGLIIIGFIISLFTFL